METIEEVNIKKKKKTGVFCFLIIIRSTISKFVQIRGGYAWKTRERCIPNTTNRGCILPYVFIVDETWRRSKNSASTLKLMPFHFGGKKFFFFNAQRKSRDVEYINAKLRVVEGEERGETLFFFCFVFFARFFFFFFFPVPFKRTEENAL